MWDAAILCVSANVCVCVRGLMASMRKNGSDFFCGRLDKLNRALEGPLNDESMRWT